MKTYKKPVVTVDAGMAEGVYAASGAKGTLNVSYYGVWDRWGTNGVKGPFIVLFFSAFSCIVTLPYLIFDFHPMTLAQLGCLLLAGLFASGGQFTITAAYTCAPAGEISIYDYSQIIFSTVLGFLFLRQIPDMWSFVGYGIIIAASVAMFLFNNRKRV